MSNDANQKTYFSTIDKVEQSQLLENIFKEQISVFLWEEGQEEEQLQEFILDSHNLSNENINLTTKGKILSRLLRSNLVGKDVYLKFTYQKIQYFTHGELCTSDEASKYLFSLKHAFYKGQKRTNYRLISDSLTRIQVKLDETVHECFDLSASGISLVLPESASETFKVNQVFKGSIIRISKQDFLISKIEVKGIFNKEQRPHLTVGTIQIGMAFTSIEKAVEEKLFLSINSEARSSEMRKKFGKK